MRARAIIFKGMAMRRNIRVVLIAFSLCTFSLSARERGLSFEERVRAQEAIERVYYSHQLEATEPFEKAVPRSLLEAKVTRYLKQSAALEQVWKTPVTSEMLRREWERIVAETRLPERLSEIYAALDQDPVLIQECFIRAALVDRLVRNLHEGDRLLQAGPRAKAERLVEALQRSDAVDKSIPHAEIELRAIDSLATVAEPAAQERRNGREEAVASEDGVFVREVTPADLEDWRRRNSPPMVEETSGSFIVRVLLDSGSKSLRYRQYEIEKERFDGWWSAHEERFDASMVPAVARSIPAPSQASANGSTETLAPGLESDPCAPAEAWDNGTLGGIPEPRVGHTAVWTGTLMLVWGGTQVGTTGTGERYDPLIDTWSPINPSGAPTNRSLHTATWTGNEMVVWGGKYDVFTLSSGGRYNPATDTWTAMSGIPTLGPRYSHTAIWTGTEIIFFGGRGDFGAWPPPQGSRYNPATNSWTAITTPGWTAKSNHSAVWTGTRMLIWGGSEGGIATPNGGAYDPASNTWSTITNTGAPPAALNHTAVWTGSKMIVWGGEAQTNGTQRSTGGIYDPQTDSWIPTSTAGAPAARAMHAAVWTGNQMVIWGGRSFAGTQETRYNSGGRFNPTSNTWSTTDLLSAPDPIGVPTAVWTGDKMLIWGNRAGGRYDPASDTWTPVSFGNTPRPLTSPTAVWTGNLMIVWGGLSETKAVTNRGYRYDPLLDSWSPTSELSAPAPRQNQAGVWTGSLMVVWGGRSGPNYLQSGGRYDPISDTWSAAGLSGAPPSARYSPSAVWTGDRVVIWGGRIFHAGSAVVTNTGALYDPAQDFWYSMALPSVFRSEHSAVWTGTEMIVWGGEEYPADTSRSTGERYNPSLNQWFPVTLTNAASYRRYHTAQWTGSRMLIWGGQNAYGEMNTGAAYDPALNQWTTISTSGAPPGRLNAVSVWTGKEMIVWGGTTVFGVGMNTGGRYDPVSNQWLSTTLVGAPTVRPAGVVAVWTGTHMIVWGVNVDGGRYVPGGDTTDSDSDGWSVCEGDCADNDSAIHPGAAEVCDRLDNNCDGTRDEGFPDLDADGFAACAGDCNDTDPGINPNMSEICNHRDDDCDGQVDEGFVDSDNDGYAICAGDCQDSNPAVNPGAPELCNGIDDDCNLLVDDRDMDGDGSVACGGADCDDTNPAIHPGAPEVCNGVDDDCSGQADDLPDSDGDGLGPCDDCNDTNPLVWVSPFEVTALTLSAPTTLTWDDQSWIGPETVYDVVSGIAGPGMGISFGAGSCLQAGYPTVGYTDGRAGPGLQAAYWYLVRSRNSCGTGTYGMNSLEQQRVLPDCP